MKGIVLACLVGLLFLGCERNPVEEFGKEMMVSYERSKDAADEASLRAVERYIRSYRALNGSYPESLEELQGSVSGNFDLELYDYDPQTGSLTLR